MKRRYHVISLLGVVLLFLLLVIGRPNFMAKAAQSSSSSSKKTNRKKIKLPKVGPNVTAVIYIYGHGGSPDSMQYLVEQARIQNSNTSDITAKVQMNGTFQLSQTIDPAVKFPLIRVALPKSTLSPVQTAKVMSLFLKKLMAQYGLHQFDGVGYSQGANAWLAYSLAYSNQKGQPEIQKLVTLAVPANGWIGSGQKGTKANSNQLSKSGRPKIMTRNYRSSLKRQKDFPRKLNVFNVYGDLMDGSHSDGQVTVESAKSLRYLLGKRPANYQELQIDKTQAQHTQLPRNPKVAKAIDEFLFK